MEAPREVLEAPPESRFGRYVAVSKLGAGGMGEVWRAWDTSLNRWVALKFLIGGEADDRDRFLREAQTAARLTHPNIAPVYEAGCERGRHFIAMHFVDGVTLRKLVKGDLRRAVGYMRDAARALDYAHGRGVIHRDIKPDNIMVERPGVDATSTPLGSTPAGGGVGRVYVMDFGLARSVKGDVKLSASGILIGTPAYMPPEQARGERVDRRADVYALGATLYEVMAGAPPFAGESVVDMLMRVINDEPAELPGAIGAVVAKAMSKEPVHRYRTAAEFADDLDRWLAGEPVSARPPSTFQRLGRQLARRRGVLVTAAAGVIAVAVALAIVVPRWRAEAKARAERERRLEASAKARPHLDQGREHLREIERLLAMQTWQPAAFESASQKAVAAFGRARAEDPSCAEAWMEEARVWRWKRRPERAIEACDRALAVDPTLHTARLERARTRASLYEDAHELGDDTPEARALWKQITEDLAALEGWPGAAGEGALVPALRAFIGRRYRESALALQEYAKSHAADAEVWAMAGHAWVHADDGRAAVDALTTALELWRSRAAYWVYRGMAHAHLGERTSAIADYSQAIVLNPSLVHAVMHRAKEYAATGKPREAEADYAKAIELDPKLWVVRHWRALFFIAQNRLQESEADLEAALALSPDNAYVIYDRGHVRERLGRADEAFADYARAIALDAKYWRPLVARGLIYSERKRYEEAVADFTRAIEIDPKGYEAYMNRGVAYLEWSRPADAAADFERVIGLKPELWQPYYGLGNAREAEQRWREAAAAWEEALRRNSALEGELRPKIEGARRKSK